MLRARPASAIAAMRPASTSSNGASVATTAIVVLVTAWAEPSFGPTRLATALLHSAAEGCTRLNSWFISRKRPYGKHVRGSIGEPAGLTPTIAATVYPFESFTLAVPIPHPAPIPMPIRPLLIGAFDAAAAAL